MAFEQFAKKGEKNVFSGLFGGSNDSDADDSSSDEEASHAVHQKGSNSDVTNATKIEVTQPYSYKSQNSTIEINLQENKQAGIAHQVWPAAEFLSSEWEKNRNGKWAKYYGRNDDNLDPKEDINIVELGAGVGLCGMFMAALPGPPTIGKVVVTDLPEALEGLNANIALNSARFQCAVEAGVLAWGEEGHVESIVELFGGKTPKVIVAADCIYWESLFAPLCSTLVTLTGMGCHVILAHVKRWKRDQKFFKMCTKNKLIVELLEEKIVVEPAVHTGLPEKKVMRIYHICSPQFHTPQHAPEARTDITAVNAAQSYESDEETA